MTQEQKDWLLAIVDCDQPKMTRMLNQHPELAVWKVIFIYFIYIL